MIFGRHDLAARRADLARRPARVPQHADVLQRRDADAASSRGFTSRCATAGYLFLGKAEMLLTPRRPVRPRRPQATASSARCRGATPSREPDAPARRWTRADGRRRSTPAAGRGLRPGAGRRSSSSTPTARWCSRTSRARALFGLGPRDIGRPLQDLELSYRPVELRSRIDDAYDERRDGLARGRVRWPSGGSALIRRPGHAAASDGAARRRRASTFSDVDPAPRAASTS